MKRSLLACTLSLLIAALLSACNGNQRDPEQISTESPTTHHSTNPDEDKTAVPADTASTER